MEATSAATLFGSMWPQAPAGLMISAVVTDSRAVVPGCVFVAIQGQRVDGHSFAPGAVAAGAAAVVGTRPVEGVPPEKMVVVPDILDAMISLGGNYRLQFQPLLLGVTGSVGKTTTKEFCGAVLSSFGKTLITEKNANNEIGMPNTLFRLAADVNYAVVEMGMQGLGEIRKLTLAARPDAAIITRIGISHLEHLGTIENILKAKLEICEGLPSGAPLLLNGDDAMLRGAVLPSHVNAVYTTVDTDLGDISARLGDKVRGGRYIQINDRKYGSFDAFIPAVGKHHVCDALLAYGAATRLGLSPSQCAAALAAYKPVEMREEIGVYKGVLLIEDCYNASPDSMRAALETLSEQEVKGRRFAVLGDMMELGPLSEASHRELAPLARAAGVDVLLTVGQRAALAAREAKALGLESHMFEDTASAAAWLMETLAQGDAVLVKASRSMHFEDIAGAVKAAEGPPAGERA